jgi:hypothetical protein
MSRYCSNPSLPRREPQKYSLTTLSLQTNSTTPRYNNAFSPYRLNLPQACFISIEATTSQRKRVKTDKNQGFLTTPNPMEWGVPVKTRFNFINTHKISGFMHVFYWMTPY